MYYSRQLKRGKEKLDFKDTREIRHVLESKLFMDGQKEAWLFADDKYAILKNFPDPSFKRKNIAWPGAKPKYNYCIFQYETTFLFRTYKNELHPKENEFIISMHHNLNKSWTVTFIPVGYKKEVIILLSQ